MDKIRVALLGPLNSPVNQNSIGGSEVWTYNLCRELSKDDGLDVTAFLPEGSQVDSKCLELTGKNCTIAEGQQINSKALYSINNISESVELLHLRDDFDLIHVSTFEFYYSLPIIKYLGKPTVVTLHGMNLSAAEMSDIFERFSDPTYVFISEAQRRNYAEPANHRLIYHGISLECSQFNQNPEDYYFWMGRISPEKGAYEAIQFAQRTGSKLILAGPKHNQEYFAYNIEPHLNSQIQYIGEVGQEQKNELYSKAKAFIFSATRDEPFGLVVIEANACGTPVLAFATGAMPEIVKDGVNGFLSPVGDVDSLINSAASIDQISRSGCRDYVQNNFSIERMGHEYVELYKDLVGR